MALTIRTTGVQEFLDAAGGMSVKALILGAPSAGKTRSASYWPAPIFADCEKGRMSLADRKMPYADITSTADMDALLIALEAECRKPPPQRKYQTLVLDTVDAYQRIVINERLKAEKKEALSGFGDWGYLDAKMTALVARLLRLPMNLVVNCHIKETKDGEDGPVTFAPKLKGDIREQIPGDFDLVGLMSTDWKAVKGERTLVRTIQWHPEPKYPVLKDRSGQLPKHTDVTFSDADWETIFGAITETFDELPEATDVETLPEPATTAPAPATPGRAMPITEQGVEAAVKGAKKAPAPRPEPAARTVKAPPPAKATTPAPPPAPPKTPSETPPETPALAEDARPAQVEMDESAASAAPKEDVGFPEVPPSEGDAPAAALTAQRLAATKLGATVIDPPAPAPAQDQPASDANVTRCGDAVGEKVPKPGCGRDLSEANADFVNIAQIKYGTSLCMDCMRAAAA